MRWRPRFSLRTLVVFLLLVTSGFGLWWHWEAWYADGMYDGPAPDEFDREGRRVKRVGRGASITYLVTVEIPGLRGLPEEMFGADVSPDEKRVVVLSSQTELTIHDTTEGGRLCSLANRKPRAMLPRFVGDGRTVLVKDWEGKISIYRRRRPEWWWGIFWLWEFWLTVAFAGVFLWSVVRDRRALRKRSTEEA